MNLVVLPGCLSLNSIWEKEIIQGYNKDFDKIILHRFSTCAGEFCEGINLDKEVENLNKLISNLKGDYVIFARRIGSLTVLKTIFEKGIKPKKCVFLGIPVSWALINNFHIDDWFNDFEIPSLFIQRKVDPVFYFNNLGDYLRKNQVLNSSLIEIDSTDKDFDDTQTYKNMVMDYLKS